MSETKRVFCALAAAELETGIAPWVKKLKINADKKEMNVRWTPTDLRHVTLLFLGETPTDRIPEMTEALRAAARQIPPFSLRVEGLDAFPDKRAARVIYFHVQNSRALRELRSRLWQSFYPDQDEDDYVPHLTIGRLRNSQSVTDYLSPFQHAKAGSLHAQEIILFESLLKAPFPVYKEIARVPLTGELPVHP